MAGALEPDILPDAEVVALTHVGKASVLLPRTQMLKLKGPQHLQPLSDSVS